MPPKIQLERAQRINLAPGDYTDQIQERALGKFNAGFYCTKCTEFVAVAVQDAKQADKLKQIEFVGGPITFVCPFCSERQTREVSETAKIVLTESNKRRPPLRNDVH